MTAPCPPWCERHVTLHAEEFHLASVTVGAIAVDVEQGGPEDGPTVVIEPGLHRLHPRDAFRLAAALVGVLARLEDVEQ